jgi:hypothetical protein
VIKWLNLIGLVLEFASFWFAAPELIGSERMRALEGRLRAVVARLPPLLFALLGVGMAIFGAAFGATVARDPGLLERAPATVPVYFGGVALLTAALAIFQRRITRAVEQRVVAPLLRWLIDDEGARARALAIAAVLMTAGFTLQLAAAILG